MKKFKVILKDKRVIYVVGFYFDEACRKYGLTKDDLQGATSEHKLNYK